MAAGVDISVPSSEPVIQIRETAVRMTDAGPVVDVRRGGGLEAVEVTLGPRWEGQVVVEQGLSEGDRVRIHGEAS